MTDSTGAAGQDEPAYAGIADLSCSLSKRRYSVKELTEYFLERIRAHDPVINAWITVDEDQALSHADYLDDQFAELSSLPLFGIPIGIKDLTPTAGLRTTYGSTLFRENIPTHDAVVVKRLRDAGAVILGKTNTPEFGVGCNTFNLIAGPTRNPWDIAKTVGGSSGGSGAALAAGMCTVAEGTDFGGSLRVPAAYCGILGFRTTPGMIPNAPQPMLWDTYSVTGPMARTVADLEVMLKVMSGPDLSSPLSLTYAGHSHRLPRHPRVAFSVGRELIDVHPDVERSLQWAVSRLQEAGCQTTEESPSLGETQEVTQILRAVRAAGLYGHLLADRHLREALHPGLVADIERGLQLPPTAAINVEERRSKIYSEALPFWDSYDIFVLPSVPIPPFRVEEVAPTRIGTDSFHNYSEWMVLATSISLLGWPSLAVPSLPGSDGCPLGVQLIAPPGCERHLLELARRYERVSDWKGRFPPPALRTA